MREELKKFAEYQEEVLKGHDHKGGWGDMSIKELIDCARSEFSELIEAFNNCQPDEIKLECADAANYLMMIFDNLNNQEDKQ